MNKPYGIQGEIANFPFKDIQTSFYNQDGIEIEIKDGILYAGVDDENNLEEVKELAQLYLSAWSLRQNIKVAIDFNHTWKTNSQGNKNYFLNVHDTIKLVERVQVKIVTHQVTIQGTHHIVTQEMHDSASPINDTPMVKKARNDVTLKNALYYFSEEIVDNVKPLIGIYKAIEEITRHLGKGGRTKLAKLVGEDCQYVDDVMQTAQIDRHSKEWLALKKAKAVLNDSECKERARKLITAYANSLP